MTKATRVTQDPLPPLSSHHRMPDVALIGAAKSGTTELAQWLAKHPQIGLGRLKEPNFFSHDDQFELGLDWYSELLTDLPDECLALDASTGYTRWPQHPHAARRLAHAWCVGEADRLRHPSATFESAAPRQSPGSRAAATA